MHSNINKNNAVDFDDNIIHKIKEIIEKGLYKLESFIKAKTKPNLTFYNELDCEFDEIVLKLEELELWEERRYFLAIADMVLYIVQKNSFDKDFGHCNFALELLNFFIDLFKTNIEFYKNESKLSEKDFKNHQKDYKNRYHDYRTIFYQKIYEPSGKYTDEELYEFLKSLKE